MFFAYFRKILVPHPPGFKVAEIWAQKKIFQKKLFFFSSGLSHPEPMCGGVGYQNFPKKRKKHLKSPLITGAIEAKKPKKKNFFWKKNFFLKKFFSKLRSQSLCTHGGRKWGTKILKAESIMIKYRINFINLEAFKTDHRSEITLFKTAKFPVV